ncbi:hypothetical protein NX059_011442 [Plenodomus lindquistii]|nr:hypothetical protein NX059_011442 [Plenodomus lindquistii]
MVCLLGVSVGSNVHMNASHSYAHYLRRLPANTWQANWGEPHITCQIEIVEWVLTFAYEYIKHMNVQLSGFVCKARKGTWENTLKKARTGQADYNNDSKLNTILSLGHADLPPKCKCSIPCICYDANRIMCEPAWVLKNGSTFDFEDGLLPKNAKSIGWSPA